MITVIADKKMDRDEALTALRDAGYGVIDDGGAVLLITTKGQPVHPTLLYGTPLTAATRFDSAEAAVRAVSAPLVCMQRGLDFSKQPTR